MAQLRSLERLSLPARPLSLRIGRELNRGAWGAVHKGDLDGVSVAVKKVHELLKDAPGSGVCESFSEECERLKSLFHPHVIGEFVYLKHSIVEFICMVQVCMAVARR